MNDMLLLLSYDGTCPAWDISTGKCIYVLEGHSGPFYPITFTNDKVLTGDLD